MANAVKGPAEEGTNLGTAGIREHMEVIASCGSRVGTVDRLEGNSIKLSKEGSPDGKHHFIPTAWIDHVDSHVHLNKDSLETVQLWKSDSAACGCSSDPPAPPGVPSDAGGVSSGRR
jgi:hypothetical protein